VLAAERHSGYVAAWGDVGLRWLLYAVSGPHVSISRYLDLATGRVVEDPADPHRQPSLDAPGLLVHLCSPLQRPRQDDYDSEAVDLLLTVDYDPPWALLPIDAGRPGDPTVWLAHCGRTKMRAICRDACEASLSAGVVTWATGREVDALLIASGRRLRWRVQGSGVLHTANRIFVLRPRSDVPRLLMARLPR
jgi:hypothetical protein